MLHLTKRSDQPLGSSSPKHDHPTRQLDNQNRVINKKQSSEFLKPPPLYRKRSAISSNKESGDSDSTLEPSSEGTITTDTEIRNRKIPPYQRSSANKKIRSSTSSSTACSLEWDNDHDKLVSCKETYNLYSEYTSDDADNLTPRAHSANSPVYENIADHSVGKTVTVENDGKVTPVIELIQQPVKSPPSISHNTYEHFTFLPRNSEPYTNKEEIHVDDANKYSNKTDNVIKDYEKEKPVLKLMTIEENIETLNPQVLENIEKEPHFSTAENLDQDDLGHSFEVLENFDGNNVGKFNFFDDKRESLESKDDDPGQLSYLPTPLNVPCKDFLKKKQIDIIDKTENPSIMVEESGIIFDDQKSILSGEVSCLLDSKKRPQDSNSNGFPNIADTNYGTENSASEREVSAIEDHPRVDQQSESVNEGKSKLEENSSVNEDTVEEVNKESMNKEASDLASIDTESNGARFHQSVQNKSSDPTL